MGRETAETVTGNGGDLTDKKTEEDKNFQLHRSALIAEQEQGDYERTGQVDDPEEFENCGDEDEPDC